MSQDIERFAERLRRVQPAQVPAGLKQRCVAEMRSKEYPSTSRWIFLAVPVAAILLLGFVAFWLFHHESSEPDSFASFDLVESFGDEGLEGRYLPIRTQNRLLARADEGIIFLDNGVSARRYRFHFVDTTVWENPSDGTRLAMEVPREEIILVPVQSF